MSSDQFAALEKGLGDLRIAINNGGNRQALKVIATNFVDSFAGLRALAREWYITKIDLI